MKKWINKLRKFITEDIWCIPDIELTKARKRFYISIKTLYLCIDHFIEDRLIVKASALTYSTLLAIVPLLAIIFAIARGFGFDHIIQEQLRTNLVGQGETANYIIQFVNKYLIQTKNGVFIGVGLILLLWTVINLSSNIERTFNQIWQVKKGRSLYRKITDYFSMFLLLPIILVVSSGLTIFTATKLHSMESYEVLIPFVRFLISLVPFLFTCCIFIGLYVFMPNTKVKMKYAIVPGILAGIAFQWLQFLYVDSQIAVSKYNAIYGSFAALPLFLFWMQISWTITLFGTQLSYASQNIANFSFDKNTRNISRRYYDFSCILVMSFIAKQFEKGDKPYTAEELSHQNQMPIRLTKKILNDLQDIHLIHEEITDEKSEEISYQPSIDISKLTIGVILYKINTRGSENFKIDEKHEFYKQWTLLRSYDKLLYDKMNQVLVKDL